MCLAKLFQAALNQFTFGCKKNNGLQLLEQEVGLLISAAAGITQPVPRTRRAPFQQQTRKLKRVCLKEKKERGAEVKAQGW